MNSPAKTILLSGFVAGSLDVLTAIVVYSFLLDKISATELLQSIASGFFKEKAFSGGMTMTIIGLMIHYCIAFSLAIGYFLGYPHVKFLQKQKVVSGILYGIFVWTIMNLIVITLVFPKRAPLTLESIFISMSILIAMIGLPISIITDNYYTSKHKTLS